MPIDGRPHVPGNPLKGNQNVTLHTLGNGDCWCVGPRLRGCVRAARSSRRKPSWSSRRLSRWACDRTYRESRWWALRGGSLRRPRLFGSQLQLRSTVRFRGDSILRFQLSVLRSRLSKLRSFLPELRTRLQFWSRLSQYEPLRLPCPLGTGAWKSSARHIRALRPPQHGTSSLTALFDRKIAVHDLCRSIGEFEWGGGCIPLPAFAYSLLRRWRI